MLQIVCICGDFKLIGYICYQDVGFATMKVGEKAILKCRADYAYGDSPPGGSIPAGATLTFDVELMGFHEKKKEKWDMSDEEKVTEATSLKELGTTAFKDGQFQQAAAKYLDAINMLEGIEDQNALLLSCQLNVAQANINIKDYTSAIKNATAALNLDSNNVKALYRRGLSYNHVGNPELAIEDLKGALELDPDNKPVKLELQKARKQIQDVRAQEKAAYGNVFKKVSVYDDKPLPVIPGLAHNNPKVVTFFIILTVYFIQ